MVDPVPVYFDSQKPLDTQVQEAVLPSAISSKERIEQAKFPDSTVLDQIVEGIGKTLGLTLFGFDLITDGETGNHAIIDINYFPGTKKKWFVLLEVILVCRLQRVGTI